MLTTAGIVLTLMPGLLLWSFLSLGRKRRRRGFYQKGAQEPQTGPLKDLITEYDKAVSGPQFVASFATFLVPYLAGLWSSVSLFRSFEEPTPGESMKFVPLAAICGYLGSAFFLIGHLAWRVVRSDVHPRLFIHATGRLVMSVIVSTMLVLIMGIATELTVANVAVAAIGAGLFFERALRTVRSGWERIVTSRTSNTHGELSLCMLQGVTADDEFRLREEGVADVQHLSCENIRSLVVHTNYSLERILDWKDQAILCVYAPTHFATLRERYVRGAIDITGMHPQRYSEERYAKLRDALASALDVDPAFVDRLIDNLSKDPAVEQLWNYFLALHSDGEH